MLTLINILFLIAIIISVYNIIPDKSKKNILMKRIKKKAPVDSKKKEPVKDLLNKIVDYFEYKVHNWDISFINSYKESLNDLILKAGSPKNITADRLFSYQIASTIGVVLFYVLVLHFLLEVLGFNVILIILASIIGFYAPRFWITEQRNLRTRDIQKNLPDIIDLLTLCIEAGLDFNSSIKKIIEKGKDSTLKNEFSTFQKELDMGAGRAEALRNMAKRNDIDDLNSFLIAILQAIKMGTTLGPILRSQSQQLRIRRSQRAEKLGAEAPIKMLMPLILCIFPTVFIILFGPIVMKLMGMR